MVWQGAMPTSGVMVDGPGIDGATEIRVAVVDDHAVVAQGAARLLGDQPGIRIVGVTNDSLLAERLIAEARPDLLLLDLHMPKRSGLNLASALRQRYPDLCILVYSGYLSYAYIQRLKELGVHGWVDKGISLATLVEAIQAVAAGRPIRLGGLDDLPLDLGPRQLRILELVASGLSNQEIAAQLGISPRTVEKHLETLYAIFGEKQRHALILAAGRLGVVTIPSCADPR